MGIFKFFTNIRRGVTEFWIKDYKTANTQGHTLRHQARYSSHALITLSPRPSYTLK